MRLGAASALGLDRAVDVGHVGLRDPSATDPLVDLRDSGREQRQPEHREPLAARERQGHEPLLHEGQFRGQDDQHGGDRQDGQRPQDRRHESADRIATQYEAAEHGSEGDRGEGHRHRRGRCVRARLVGPPDQDREGREEAHAAVEDPAHDSGGVRDRHLGVTRWPGHDVGRSRVVGDDDDREDHHDESDEQDHERCQGDAVVDVEHGGRDEQQHQRQQLGHLHAHERHDLVVGDPAELDGVDQGAEVVVGQDHARGLLGDLTAGAHGDADVGLLEGRRVVHRVARHGHDQPGLLHDPGQAQLVVRGDPTEDVQVWQPLP